MNAEEGGKEGFRCAERREFSVTFTIDRRRVPGGGIEGIRGMDHQKNLGVVVV